jgi:hypothetical protein
MRRCGRLLLPVLLLVVAGCAGRYFRDAGQSPGPFGGHHLSNWPYSRLWTGLVFNGEKIGFSHLSLAPSPDAPGVYRIRSEAVIKIRFLMFDKHIELKSLDEVDANLALIRFEYDYTIDGHRKRLTGYVTDRRIDVTISTAGQTRQDYLTLNGPVHPTSIINMYPVMHGTTPGRRYRYPVYDGETHQIQQVVQHVGAYEESDLFDGAAFHVETRFLGQTAHTWINDQGMPVFEMTMGGVLLSVREDEKTAATYLAKAALSKRDTMLEFSRIQTTTVLQRPEAIRHLEVRIAGGNGHLPGPADCRQACRPDNGAVICRIDAVNPAHCRSVAAAGETHGPDVYLQPSITVSAYHPRVVRLAETIAAAAPTPKDRVQRLLDWIAEEIQPQPVDVFSALDVLDGKRAECQGQAFLYAALARSLGIPTRVVNGIVYSAPLAGFVYHTWAESFIDGRWTAVDPILHQNPADATHIKLLEGETTADLQPLVKLIGQLEIKNLSAM